MGKINAICISEKRGTAKKFVEAATFQTEFGIVGDAELAEKIRETIYRKPREHLWQLGIRNEELGINWRQMYQIGG